MKNIKNEVIRLEELLERGNCEGWDLIVKEELVHRLSLLKTSLSGIPSMYCSLAPRVMVRLVMIRRLKEVIAAKYIIVHHQREVIGLLSRSKS